ncbi:MAG: type II toxin-antitoxin system YafQ family toxin [Flavisolibacter sp.]
MRAPDCHISSNWGLIYAVGGEGLRLIRTGTHSDLFKYWISYRETRKI